MKRLTCIGEGHGERLALPQLCHSIRKYLGAENWSIDPEIVRINRSDFVAPRLHRRAPTVCNRRGLERAVALARRRPKPADAVLVLCDADDDCVAEWVKSVHNLPWREIPVIPVMAMREFEAWLLWNQDMAALREIGVDDPEAKRDAKGALKGLIPGYAPTTHQLEHVKRLDVAHVRARSRSFDKLVRELAQVFAVTPPPRPAVAPMPVAKANRRGRNRRGP